MNDIATNRKRHVFLTGATGAIGSRVLAALLEEPSTTLALLIRDSRTGKQATDRLREVLVFLGLDAEDPALHARMTVISGNLTQPRFGMNDNDYQREIRRTTHFIHAAGNVKLNQSLENARRDAVTTMQEMVDFIKAARPHGIFIKGEYLSTVGVCGHRDGIVPETPLPDPRHFRNTYEAAKAEAEDRVLSEIQKGLPVTIHRPSMVVGDSRTGALIHFQVFYYLLEFLLGTRSWGIIPQLGVLRLDTIPVDYVARAILISSHDTATIGRIFHLCAGPQHSLLLTAVAQLARDRARNRGRRLPTLKPINPRWISLVLPILSRILPAQMQRELKSVPFLLSYLQEDQMFDNEQSTRYFVAQGLSSTIPALYLPRLIDHYLDKKASSLG